MTRPRLPIDPALAAPMRRGGVRGTGAASGSPTDGRTSTKGSGDGPLLIDSREVARLLGIGRTKTFQLMASGQLPTIRLGRCVRVPAAALDRWIETLTQSPSDID